MKRNLLISCILACCAMFPNKATGQEWTYSYYTNNWTDIENGVVFTNWQVVRIPIYDKSNYYMRNYVVFAYLEAPLQRTYINKITFTINLNSSYSSSTYGSYYYYYTIDGVITSSNYNISDGQQITLDQVNQYLHIRNSTLNAELDLVVSNWSNITKSTSENYTNYLSNTGTGTADSYGDYTSKLSSTWTSDNISSETVTDNWTGEEGAVYKITGSASQTVTGLKNGTYTVQGIVRGTKPVKLTLNEVEAASAETYGIGSEATFSTVNFRGRVDYNYDMGNNGWTKVEGTATLNSTGSLTIAFSSEAEFQLSDVVLLKDANTEGHYYTSANKIDDSATYYDLSEQTTNSSSGATIYYPTYNAFSFFDRGTNHNAVIYAHPRTVIGCNGEQVDYVDHRHPVNTAVETISTDNPYLTSVETGDYECQLLSLYDNVSELRVNGNPFGINKDFTAINVIYDRTVKAGQYTTGYFPFALTSTDLTNLYGSGSAYTFSQVSDNNAIYTDVTEVAANTPFLIKPGAGKDGLIVEGNITNRTIVATPSTSSPNTATFRGTYTDLTLTNGTSKYYIFNAQNDQGLFRPIKSTGAYVKPFRAYLEVPVSSGAKPYYLFSIGDNSTTGIENIDTDLSEKSVNYTVYTLDGRKAGTTANWQTLPKGIYIVNGKKVVKQ